MKSYVYNKENEFYVQIEDKWFNPKDVLTSGDNHKIQVLESPYRRWYKVLFQWITFGLYKAPYQYNCKIVKK